MRRCRRGRRATPQPHGRGGAGVPPVPGTRRGRDTSAATVEKALKKIQKILDINAVRHAPRPGPAQRRKFGRGTAPTLEPTCYRAMRRRALPCAHHGDRGLRSVGTVGDPRGGGQLETLKGVYADAVTALAQYRWSSAKAQGHTSGHEADPPDLPIDVR